MEKQYVSGGIRTLKLRLGENEKTISGIQNTIVVSLTNAKGAIMKPINRRLIPESLMYVAKSNEHQVLFLLRWIKFSRFVIKPSPY